MQHKPCNIGQGESVDLDEANGRVGGELARPHYCKRHACRDTRARTLTRAHGHAADRTH